MAMTMGMTSSWATTAVEKATSELLNGPDWTVNISICDSVNSNPSQAKDVVKAVKRRLQHKNPKVQLLSLTLLETMVKNCGDYVHFQIAEKNLLGEMVKIVRKRTDMHVRDKILVLLDSWQEAFGGPGGKYPQYYWTYDELRRSGVEFPRRSLDAVPIFTPPVTHPTRHAQAGYGMPSNSARRLDETMAADTEGLSLSSLDSMRNVMELLSDMLQAVNPSDHGIVKDEVIVDLVDCCRSNQKKLMQMLTTTGDEELLGRGLQLNDNLQMVLAKHDAIASGSPMPVQVTSSSSMSSEQNSFIRPTEVKRDSSPTATDKAPAVANSTKGQIDEDEEEEDDFAQLARRHSKTQSSPAEGKSESSRALVPVDTGYMSSPTSTSSPALSNALALPDPPASVRTTKEQDIIDLLSMNLSTTSTSSHQHSPHSPSASAQNMPQTPPPSVTQGHAFTSQTFLGNLGQPVYNSYVAPWAQPQPQPQPQNKLQPPLESNAQPQLQQNLHPHTQQHLHTQFHPYAQPQSLPEQQWQPQPPTQLQPQPQPQPQPPTQLQPQPQPQPQPQFQSQYSHYSSGYPPPPWATTPGYANGHLSATTSTFSTPRASTSTAYNPMQAARTLQHTHSFPSRESNGSTMNDNLSSGSRNPAMPMGQKPFIPSYRLFEDLNVFGNGDGKYKMTSSASPNFSGTSGQGMVGGRK